MKVWLVSFVLLFLLAEVFLWLKDVILPLPIYVFAGAALAIASNYDKGIASFFVSESKNTEEPISQTATLVDPVLNKEEENK